MIRRIPTFLLRSTRDGPTGTIALIVRLAAGIAILLIGIGKFTSYSSEVGDFRHYGVPAPHVAVILAGIVEVLGGLLVVVGLATRLAAGAVALNLVVAVLTAGRVDGGFFHLVIGPTLLVAMVVLVVLGCGTAGLDGVIERRRRSD